jgi:signal transduction histidine kinase
MKRHWTSSGDIRVDSEPEQGTTFIVVLPHQQTHRNND